MKSLLLKSSWKKPRFLLKEILFKYASDTNNGKKIAETDYAKITDKNDRSKWKQAMTLYRNSLFE